ncbi:MAG: ribonuclease P protein component [Rhodospirillaceae bacterium]|nr:ribonuclease P protein component [Rhodospirillaceae bacterium]|tara:strand:+ start:2576 stop:2986 length:411 start_codon:yes stop_codon:yes gene_type:complete
MSHKSRTASQKSDVQVRPVIERLKVRSDFLRIAADRRNWAAPGLVLQVSETPKNIYDRDTIRIGYTASRKVGNSVKRNRARRRLRNVVEKVMTINASRGKDFVIIARKNTIRRPFSDLIIDLETALKKLDAWEKKA